MICLSNHLYKIGSLKKLLTLLTLAQEMFLVLASGFSKLGVSE